MKIPQKITIDKTVYDDLVKVSTWVKEQQYKAAYSQDFNNNIPVDIRAAAGSAWEHTLPMGEK